MFKWLTGQAHPPPEMAVNPAYVKLAQHTRGALSDVAKAGTRAAAGKDWVRGWGDTGTPTKGGPSGVPSSDNQQ